MRGSRHRRHRVGCAALLVVTTSLIAGCTHDKTPTAARGSSTQRVVSGGLSIDVPSDWPVDLLRKPSCPALKAPGVLVGSFNELRDCFVFTWGAGPAVLFGSGGPPLPPVPTTRPDARIVNGVRVLVQTVDTGMDESEFLAVFPGRDAWLRIEVKSRPATARDEGDRILETVRSVDAGPVPRTDATRESFLGVWHVHGSQLEIKSATGVVGSNCGPPCVETEALSLSLSTDGSRLSAVVTSVSYTNGDTGRRIANPFPHDSVAVGDTSYFEFVAPHLMKETILRSAVPPSERGYGNPYWCGQHLDPALDWACGL